MNTQKKFKRAELEKRAREKKIPYYYEITINELREKLDLKAKPTTKTYSRGELSTMARESGIKNFYKLTKHELAKKLGIELPKQKPNPNPRIARSVQILNGTIYPSISKASQALGKHPLQIYNMVDMGEAKFL